MTSKKINFRVWLPWSTCSIATLPVVPNAVNSICMMVWAALVLCAFWFDGKEQPAPRHPKWLVLLFGGNFLLLAISLLYTNDLSAGSSFLTTELPMILFPFLFRVAEPFLADRTAVLKKVLTVFWVSTVLMALWVFYKYWQQGLWGEFIKADSFNLILRNTAEKTTDKHPDYLSLFLVFSLFIAGSRLFDAGSKRIKVLYGLSMLPQLLLLLLLAARSPILGMIAGSLIVCFLRIKRPLLRWMAALTVAGGFFLIIRLTPSIWSRLVEVKNTPLETPVGIYFNSTNLRVGIFKCSWQVIRDHTFTGVGAGGDRKALMDCYAQFPTDAYRKSFYNTHDQYLNFWLLSGIFSLLLFLFSLAWSFHYSLRRKDHLMLFFLILMTIAFLSENVLSRQAGVVFYYFFICLMVYRHPAQPVGKADG